MSGFRLPAFYPIVDTATVRGRGLDAREAARTLLGEGARILQYRHKDPWTQKDYDEAAAIAELCRASHSTYILNDRADYAKLLDAGLHVGQDDLPPVGARSILGEGAVIGLSTHNKRQLLLAADEPIEYAAVGPVFATQSKQNASPELGLERVRLLRKETKLPLVAIGGIMLSNAQEVLKTGVDSLAVISGYLAQGTELTETIRRWIALR